MALTIGTMFPVSRGLHRAEQPPHEFLKYNLIQPRGYTMSHSKQELQEIARQVQEGRYVSKGTLYVSVGIALALGLYVGNLLTTIYSPAPIHVTQAQQAPVPQAPQAQQAQIDPNIAAQILKYEKITRDDPANADAWIHLGHAYFDSDKPKAAITAYTRALELAPGNADVHTDLGVMYRRAGEPRKALEQFDIARGLNPKHEQSRFNKGIVLMHDLNQKEAALAAWKELLSINPNAKAPNGMSITELIRQHSN